MKTMVTKIFAITFFFLFTSTLSFAQWAGSSDTLNSIYRLGNVGIGTNNPYSYSILHLKDTGSNTILRIEAPGSWESKIEMAADNDIWQFQAKATNLFTLNSNAMGDIMAWKYDTGNVGIGTTSPSQKLDVSGNIKLNGDIYLGDNQALLGGVATQDKIGFTSGSGVFNVRGSIVMDIDNNNADTNRFWAVTHDGGNQLIRVQENGNVGIGTVSPTEKLDVNGNLLLRNSTNTNLYLRNPGGTGNSIIFWQKSSGADEYYFGQTTENGDLKIYNYDSNSYHITFKKGGSTIFNEGNVGIGTTEPAKNLEISQSTDGTTLRITSEQNDASHLTTTPFGSLEFYSYDESGVGAGVRGAIRSYPGSTTGGGAHLAFFSSFGTGETEAMRINNMGNIGIGTTSPQENLDIHFTDNDADLRLKTTYDSGHAHILIDGASNGDAGIFLRKNGANKWNITSSTLNSNSLVIADGSVNKNRLTFALNGDTYFENSNVGIGTTDTFSYKLAVNGTIGAKEVIVETTSAWPDYVFDEAYELRSLEEVEQFTKEHKHLPNVPNQSEVKEKGINVGEMNAVLLQKIEELTLYIIEQQKQIQHLTERVNSLEN